MQQRSAWWSSTARAATSLVRTGAPPSTSSAARRIHVARACGRPRGAGRAGLNRWDGRSMPRPQRLSAIYTLGGEVRRRCQRAVHLGPVLRGPRSPRQQRLYLYAQRPVVCAAQPPPGARRATSPTSRRCRRSRSGVRPSPRRSREGRAALVALAAPEGERAFAIFEHLPGQAAGINWPTRRPRVRCWRNSPRRRRLRQRAQTLPTTWTPATAADPAAERRAGAEGRTSSAIVRLGSGRGAPGPAVDGLDWRQKMCHGDPLGVNAHGRPWTSSRSSPPTPTSRTPVLRRWTSP